MIVNLIINKKISTDLTVEQFSDEVVKLFKPKQTDEKQLENLINQLIELNPKVVKDYKKGKKNAILFLVGKVMREMRGKVDAKVVIEKIKKQLL
jgi:aspartyl-tRNA(Asn)/glutamyl-tRNA(Gln) amidotransferase subunit B